MPASPSFDTLLIPQDAQPEDLARCFVTTGVPATVAAAGSAQGDAAALVNHFSNVTGGDAAVGVRLPLVASGQTYTVFNNSAAVLLVYPDSGSKIGTGSTNAALSQAAGTSVVYERISSTVWCALGVATVSFSTGGSVTVGGDLTVSGGDIDLGSSGAAGTVDIFPTTASKGKVQITAGDSAGDTTTSITTASQAAARTYTVPDALASADFLLGAQAAVARTATSDGLTTGTIADKGRFQHVTVTSADANNIIVLPTPTPGTQIVLNVGATGFELRTSAPASVAINGGSGSNAESAIPANSTVFMTCVSATAWKGYYMDADGDLAKVEVAA